METWPFLAVLGSALLHAVWNAAARSGAEPGEVMVCGVVLSGGVGLAGLAFTGLPEAVSLPWAVVSVLINTIGIRFAMAAYRSASFGLAYPVMRAGIPLLVLPIAVLALGEWPRPVGAAGVLLVAAALIMLAIAASRAGRNEPSACASAATCSPTPSSFRSATAWRSGSSPRPRVAMSSS